MSRELAHDKRLQAGLSATAAVAGLSALGLKGVAVGTRQAARRAPALAARLRATPQVAERADKGSVGLLTVGAGVGGASGLKFAAIQRKEAKQQERGVRKDYHDESVRRAHIRSERERITAGRFAPLELGHQRAQVPVKAPVRAFPKRRKDYGGINPEARRQRRMKIEQGAAAAGAVGSSAIAVGYGRNAVEDYTMLRGQKRRVKRLYGARDRSAKAAWLLSPANGMKPNAAKHSADALRHGNNARRVEGHIQNVLRPIARTRVRQAGKAGAAAAVLGAGAYGISRMRQGQGRHYRDWWDG